MKRKNIITIGSFDGIHLGHQALIHKTLSESKKINGIPTVFTFKIPPKMVLKNSLPISILSTPLEKEIQFFKWGIKKIKFWNFGSRESKIQPKHFFTRILLPRYNLGGLVVGSDFRFGSRRKGGVAELKKWGKKFQFPVWIINPVRYRGRSISSSWIRQLIHQNKIKKAVRILGHPYSISGRVVPGNKLGRKLGFPTANLVIPSVKILPRGVVFGRGWIYEKNNLKTQYQASAPHFWGVANIGVRPTLSQKSKVVTEIHSLQGKTRFKDKFVVFEIMEYLRPEKRFSDYLALRKAIGQDVQKSRSLIKKYS